MTRDEMIARFGRSGTKEIEHQMVEMDDLERALFPTFLNIAMKHHGDEDADDICAAMGLERSFP